MSQSSPRVMHTFGHTRGSGNPYTTLLNDAINGHTAWRSAYFSWPNFVLLRWDVLHIHWPEFLLRDENPARARVKSFLFRGTLRLARRTSRTVIRTVHNVLPHEVDDNEAHELAQVDALTQGFVVLNSLTPTPNDLPRKHIPHGHYRTWYADYLSKQVTKRGYMLFFGSIRPYKGVSDLIHAFAGMDAKARGSLRIAGPISENYRRELESIASSIPGLEMRLERLTDAELFREVSEAEIVVLPYRRVENSGSLLLALSLGTPVVTTASNAASELQTETGEEWIQLIDTVTPQTLQRAVDKLRSTRRAPSPELEKFSWVGIATETVSFYTSVRRSLER